jgi:hypothetical protein
MVSNWLMAFMPRLAFTTHSDRLLRSPIRRRQASRAGTGDSSCAPSFCFDLARSFLMCELSGRLRCGDGQ